LKERAPSFRKIALAPNWLVVRIVERRTRLAARNAANLREFDTPLDWRSGTELSIG